MPPKPDVARPTSRKGYWFSLAPAFQPAEIVRDFPLAVEPTKNKEFHALTFVDLVGKDSGCCCCTPARNGSAATRRAASELVMREWESISTQEYGWPVYSEYRHALRPHAGKLTNADRLRAAAAFGRPLLARVGPPQAGDLPAAQGLRHGHAGGRATVVFPQEARRGQWKSAWSRSRAPVGGNRGVLASRWSAACETNLLGAKVADVAREGNQLAFPVDPWKIRTFEITPG